MGFTAWEMVKWVKGREARSLEMVRRDESGRDRSVRLVRRDCVGEQARWESPAGVIPARLTRRKETRGGSAESVASLKSSRSKKARERC